MGASLRPEAPNPETPPEGEPPSLGPTDQPTLVYLDSTAAAELGRRIDQDLLGQRLGVFEIRSLLGKGGMGRVYLAWHERLHRLCAVKIVPPGLVRAQPQRLEMFLTEARTAARLQHPNIVAIHSLGEDRGYPFIEMEYIEGKSLNELLRQHVRLPAQMATRLIAQIAAGLALAHEKQVLHRDVKPSNVMVASNLHVKITDFGLARAFADDGAAHVVGTPHFMAPELVVGGSASPASDVYAMGATYFALLTGKVPYQASSFAELKAKHLWDAVPRAIDLVPETPVEVDAVVQSMLAKDPQERPGCNTSLVERLSDLADALTDMRHLVEQAMEDQDIAWTERGKDRYAFVVGLAAGRRQTVLAEPTRFEGSTETLLSFWTPCAPAHADNYAFVLDLNSRLPFGAVSVRQHEGRPYFVMVQNHARTSLDPEEIRASVLNLARWADLIEQELTDSDIH